MDLHRNIRLRDIANAGEDARRVLDRFDLDYCCEGNRTLGEACDAAGLKTAPVEAELFAVEATRPREWLHPGISMVLERVLGECHPRTKRLLGEATAAASALAGSDPRARPLAEALGALASQASTQMREEEETLYAPVRALADARMGRGPYPPPPFRTIHEHGDRLRDGHKRTHDHIRRVRMQLASLEGIDAAKGVRPCVENALSALTEQMHLENNELLPRARDLEPNGYPANP